MTDGPHAEPVRAGQPSPGFERYARQMLLPGFGHVGQQRLAEARVAIIGCGALGTVVADALVRAGVGAGAVGSGAGRRRGLVAIADRDIVEPTNLQRQVLFDDADARAGAPKAAAAAARLMQINPQANIRPIVADVNAKNVESICADADVVIDGTDNFRTRYLLNDACVKHGTPLVYGGVVGTIGLTMTIIPPLPITRGTGPALADDTREPEATAPRRTPSPCLRCVFPDPPAAGAAPTCDTAGVLGPMVGIVASIQASEAMKVILGRFDLLRSGLSQFDVWNNLHRTIDLSSLDPAACPCCAARRFEFLDAPVDASATLCGADSVQVLADAPVTIGLNDFAARMRRAGHPEFIASRFMARGRIDGHVLTLFADGRAIVKGTTDLSRARSVYARYVGN